MATASFQIEPKCTDSLAPFWQRLGETIAWCQSRAVLKLPRDGLEDSRETGRTLDGDYRDCVARVAVARARRLWPNLPEATQDLAGGRLLLYFPDADLCCGAAEMESRGFFDVFNTPPKATWVAFVSEIDGLDNCSSNYLVAWVPPEFVELANAGVRVNPEECIQCLDESKAAFADFLVSQLTKGV